MEDSEWQTVADLRDTLEANALESYLNAEGIRTDRAIHEAMRSRAGSGGRKGMDWTRAETNVSVMEGTSDSRA